MQNQGATGQASRCGTATAAEPCIPCLMAQLVHAAESGIDDVVSRIVPRGAPLFRQGEPLQFLYAVRRGTVKLTVTARDGYEQVTGFRMSGELIGLDALADERHPTSAWAVEEVEVYALRCEGLQDLFESRPDFGPALWKLLSRELLRDKKRLILLGTMSAEERVAAFLQNFSVRSAESGGDASAFALPMTRGDIASYLGLTIETVSRILHRFHREGVLASLGRRGVRLAAGEPLRAMLPRKPAPTPGPG